MSLNSKCIYAQRTSIKCKLSWLNCFSVTQINQMFVRIYRNFQSLNPEKKHHCPLTHRAILAIFVMSSDPYFISLPHFYDGIGGRHNISCVLRATPSIGKIVRHWTTVKNDFRYEIFFCVWHCCPAEGIHAIGGRSEFPCGGIVSTTFIQWRLIKYNSLTGFQVYQITFAWRLESNYLY